MNSAPLLLSFREIEIKDYEQIENLLSQLTEVGNIKEIDFALLLIKLRGNHKIICCEYNDIESNETKIIGIGTLLLEYKIIHNFGIVAHIEDIVVDKTYRSMQVGKQIINYLIQLSKDKNAYKIILNCNEKNIGFYEKCGFYKNEVEMRLDINT
tara:strand:+ start:4872 stop:5333 length:462 start_codon:yes stop_codon:yes gene_type:complete